MTRSNVLSRSKMRVSVAGNGSVAYETSRARYRGFVTINGSRYATSRYATRLGARRALNRMIKEITLELTIT